MGKPTAQSKLLRRREDAEGSRTKKLGVNEVGSDRGNRKSEGYGLPGPECSPVTTARKHKEDEHKMNKRLQPVVVLERLCSDEEIKAMMKREEPKPVQPQARLPPEIITMILGYLKDPTDLQNCSRADPVLSDLLTPRKPEYLFEQALSHLFGYLSFGDLKNCGLVCKEWRRVVNELIENRPCVRPYNDEVFLKEMGIPQTRQNFGVTTHSRLRPFTQIKTDRASLQEFAASYNSLNFGGRNPFLGGAVEFLVEATPEIMNNINENIAAIILALTVHVWELSSFLNEFGHHIQHLRLKSQEVAPLVETRCLNYALLCLRHCPNLKTISIDMSHQENIIPHGRVYMLVGEAATLLGGHTPLPHLHTIEVAATVEVSIPSIFMETLMNPYWTQLQKLSIPCPFYHRRNHVSAILQTQLPNLKEFRIEEIRSNEVLERLSEVEAPVEQLALKFIYEDVNISTLMRELHRFPLRHLELDWESGVLPSIPKPPPTEDLPEIPSVHTLKMTNSVEVNYSFLRCFPNLKHLYLHEQIPANGSPLQSRPSVRLMKKIASSEDVQIHKYLYGGQMNRSNIWSIFQNLEVVVFERVRRSEEAPEEKWKLTWGRRANRRQS